MCNLKFQELTVVPDIQLKHNELLEVLRMLPKYSPTFKYMKMKVYPTGIALYTKKGRALIFYDKWTEIKKKHPLDYKNYSKYIDVLRIELRYRKNNIKNLSEKTKTERKLDKLVTKQSFEDYFINVIKDFVYTGDFYSLETATQKIKLSNYSNTIKKNLISFITEINKYGLKSIKTHTSRNTILSYVDRLSAIGINPITTISSDYIEGFYSRILKKCNDYVDIERSAIDE